MAAENNVQQVPPLNIADRPTCTELLRLGADGIRHWLTTFDTVLTDCDGVLWLHNTAIVGSAAVIARLQALGKRVFLVTNNSSRTRAQFAAKAADLEYNVSAAQIVSTAHVAATYLHAQLAATDRWVYVIGSEGITRELDTLGVKHCGFGPDPGTTLAQLAAGEFQPDPRVGAVIVGFDEHFGFAKLCKAATYLQQPQCTVFVATSIDQRSPVRGACIPGTGAMLRAVEEVAGRRALVLGKPDPMVLRALMAENDIRADRTLMIGDRCNTDVALGRNCGFQTLLVGTGISQLADVARCADGEVPDWYLPSLGDLGEWLN